MDHKVSMLANRWQEISIGDEFVNIVQSSAEKYEWSHVTEDQFSILFSFHVAQHLKYDEISGFKITSPQTRPCEYNEDILGEDVTSIYDNAMHAFESKIPALFAKHFTSPLMKNSFQDGMTLTEEQLTRLTEMTTAKMRETVAQPFGNNDARVSAQVISIDYNSLQIGLRDIASMMQDGALLASILQKPAIAQSLSSVSTGIERAVSGIEKVSKTTSLLSQFAGALSLFTGIAGIVSAVVGLFSDDKQEDKLDRLSEQLGNLGKQVEHLGKQLDCVLKNQMIMVDMLAITQRRIAEIDHRLIQFAKTTKLQFDFLKTKDLVEACVSIDRHLKKTNAVQLNAVEVRQKLMILETWLRDHLSSPIMNGAMYANALPAEALEILASAASDAASMNMIGFVLARLHHHNIAIPQQFLNLPPFQLYAEIAGIFTLGLEVIG